MGAAFREVWPNFGVEETSQTDAKMIVPLKTGANIVALVGGKDAHVDPADRNKVTLKEFPVSEMSARIAKLPRKPPAGVPSLGGDVRYFQVRMDTKSGGSTGILCTAGSAKLYVNTLEQRPIKVAIRHVAGPGPDGNHSRRKADFDALVDEMNAIWIPQANVLFKLVASSRVTIDAAKLVKALGKDFNRELPENVDITRYGDAFQREIASDADLTFFLLYKVSDSGSTSTTFRGDRDRVLGVTRREGKFALISDDRTSSTMAHEAGHFRGSGHTESSKEDLLMRDGGAGTKIPYDAALSLNGKY
jgi:hypothetical protein